MYDYMFPHKVVYFEEFRLNETATLLKSKSMLSLSTEILILKIKMNDNNIEYSIKSETV